MSYRFRHLFLVTVLLVMTSLAAISFSAVGCGSYQGEGGISSNNETQALNTVGENDQGKPSSSNHIIIDLPPMPDPIIVNPKLDGDLYGLIEADKRGEAESFARQRGIELVDGKVRVEIMCDAGQLETAAKAASRFGTVEGTVRGTSSKIGLIEAFIPIISLSALSEDSSIRFIRVPIKGVPGSGS